MKREHYIYLSTQLKELLLQVVKMSEKLFEEIIVEFTKNREDLEFKNFEDWMIEKFKVRFLCTRK